MPESALTSLTDNAQAELHNIMLRLSQCEDNVHHRKADVQRCNAKIYSNREDRSARGWRAGVGSDVQVARPAERQLAFCKDIILCKMQAGR